MCGAHTTVGSTTMPIISPMMSMSIMLGVVSVSNPLHYSIETIVRSSNVVDNTNCTICFFESIWSFQVVTISVFILFFFVPSVWIMDQVVKMVMSWVLKNCCNRETLYKYHSFQLYIADIYNTIIGTVVVILCSLIERFLKLQKNGWRSFFFYLSFFSHWVKK